MGKTDDAERWATRPTGKMTRYQADVGAGYNTGILGWDTDGSLGSLTITDTLNSGGTHTCNFAYNDLSRLITDDCGAAWSQTFTYDQYNNLTKAGSSAWNPGYNTKNQYSTIGATYNADGNMTYDSTNHYVWDGFDKMVGVGSAVPVCGTSGTCITYDAFGRDVEKSVGSVYSEILYSPIGKTALMTNPTTVYNSHIPLPGGGALSIGGGYFYLHSDWLGTARVASTVPTSGNGSVTYDRAFAPYGERYLNFGAASPNVFTGDTQDILAGLSDTPNRELNNGQGRWTSPDPSGSGWNAYAYPTDPNVSTDPTGLACYPFEKKTFGSCAGFMNNGVNFGGNWNEFDILNWALTAYIRVIPDPDRTVNYPYGWIDYESGAFYPPGTYVFGWSYGNTFFPYAWLLNFDPGSYFNSYYNAKRSAARSVATSEDYIKALGNLARKAPDLCNPGITASAKVAGYGPEVNIDQHGVHGDFTLGLGKHVEVTADPSITLNAGELFGGSVTLNADHLGIPTVGAFAGVRTSNKFLEVDANVHADVVAMGSCPQ